MERKINAAVALSVTFSAIAIPQILFHWLVPTGFEAREAVYILGTLFTAVSAITGSVCCCKYGLQKGMAAAVVCAVLGILVTAVCGVLVALDAPQRSCIYALSVFFPLYLMCLVPLVATAQKSMTESSTVEEASLVPSQHVTPLPPRRI